MQGCTQLTCLLSCTGSMWECIVFLLGMPTARWQSGDVLTCHVYHAPDVCGSALCFCWECQLPGDSWRCTHLSCLSCTGSMWERIMFLPGMPTARWQSGDVLTCHVYHAPDVCGSALCFCQECQLPGGSLEMYSCGLSNMHQKYVGAHYVFTGNANCHVVVWRCTHLACLPCTWSRPGGQWPACWGGRRHGRWWSASCWPHSPCGRGWWRCGTRAADGPCTGSVEGSHGNLKIYQCHNHHGNQWNVNQLGN